MRAEDIRDEASLKAWLEARPEATRQRDAVWIAFRAAARAANAELSFVETDLRSHRLFLTTHTFCLTDDPKVRAVLAKAHASSEQSNDSPQHYGYAKLAPRLLAGLVSDPSLGSFVRNLADVLPRRRGLFNPAIFDNKIFNTSPRSSAVVWREIAFDAAAVQREANLATEPLFSNVEPPAHEASSEDSALGTLFSVEWEFWEDWWRGLEDGAPLRLALQEKVALIPDRIWQQGAAAVAEEIQRIEQFMALEQEAATLQEAVETLRSELAALRDEVRGRGEGGARFGDNGGPPLEEIEAVVAEVGTVAETLTAVQTALVATDPDRSVLHTLGASLLRGGVAVGRYLGARGDLLVTETIKGAAPELGKWGVRAALFTLTLGSGGHVIAPDLVQKLIDFALKLKGL